jgi:UDP-glucose 4-epimerase
MKVVVTGGAGYIGAALVEKLSFLPEVKQIDVYDNLSSGNLDFFFNTQLKKEKVNFIEGDILETRKLAMLVKGADVVVHLASLDSSASYSASVHHLEQVNHWGTAELSYAVENENVPKFIFLSTAEVYGFSDEIKTEDSIANAVTPYAESKLRAEAHAVRLASKIESIVLRSGIVSGFGSVKNYKGVANKLFLDAITKKRVSLLGDGKQVRPFLGIDHLVYVLENAVIGRLASGIYNVSQVNCQVLDVLEELKKVLPDTEFIFANHHLALPSLKIASKHGGVVLNENFQFKQEFANMLKHVKI